MEKEKEKSLRYILLEKMQTLVTAGLGLVAALAWNDAIKGLFAIIFKNAENSLIAQFIYAILITVVVVILTVLLSKSLKRAIGN